MNKACFLDRDGVLITDMDYLKDPEKVELIPRAAEALKMLKKAGYMIIVISNQSGVARGMFEESDVIAVNRKINELLSKDGIPIDDFYYCPHHFEGNVAEYSFECECRKPSPGMILQATEDHDIDLSKSFMIGDKVSDFHAANNAGCHLGILVRTGHGESQIAENDTSGIQVCDDISCAVEWYLRANKFID